MRIVRAVIIPAIVALSLAGLALPVTAPTVRAASPDVYYHASPDVYYHLSPDVYLHTGQPAVLHMTTIEPTAVLDPDAAQASPQAVCIVRRVGFRVRLDPLLMRRIAVPLRPGRCSSRRLPCTQHLVAPLWR